MSGSLRILHLIPTLAGGGAERQLCYISGELVKMGHEIHVGFFQPGANLDRLVAGGAVAHRLPVAANHDPRLLGRVSSLVKSVRPQIVQTWLLQMDVLGGLALLGKRTPWVLSERASGPAYPRGIKTGLRKLLARRVSAVVSNSQTGDAYWNGCLPASIPRRVIRNGLPVGEIDAIAPARKKNPNGPKRILFAGRLCEQRNLKNLVPALGLVLRQENAEVALCGVGPLKNDVETWLNEAGISGRVSRPGYLPEHELWAQMKSADVFVSVSHFEGQPNAVMEAMACKCPLVLSDIPEHRECGSALAPMANPDSRDEIAAALLNVLRDPAAAKIRAEAAYAAALRHSTAQAAREYEELYRALLLPGRENPACEKTVVKK